MKRYGAPGHNKIKLNLKTSSLPYLTNVPYTVGKEKQGTFKIIT